MTFELPDSAKECFHEVIEKDVEATVEFQVNSWGIFSDKTQDDRLFVQCKLKQRCTEEGV